MRASSILQDQLREGTKIIHAKRWSALWRAVTGLVEGGQLWLTALGRALPGTTTDKHRIRQRIASWAIRVSNVRYQNSTQF